jgi:hypothetical protein
MWSLNDNMIERLLREIELEIESLMTSRILLM